MISAYVRKEYTKAQLIYLAGIMDGKGSFIINVFVKKSKKGTTQTIAPIFHTTLQVSSTDKVLINWIVENFGSKLQTCNRKQKHKNTRQTFYRWTAYSDRVKHLCESMLPYLVMKKRQAEIMIQMRDTFEKTNIYKGQQGTQPISQEVIDLRYILFNEMESLHIR